MRQYALQWVSILSFKHY